MKIKDEYLSVKDILIAIFKLIVFGVEAIWMIGKWLFEAIASILFLIVFILIIIHLLGFVLNL